MEDMNDNELLEELSKRFRDNKKALHDLTVMNQKIEKLNMKLAESERLKTNFLSNIRNEINNPLTSILAMAKQLAQPGRDEATRRLMAGMIYREAFELDFQLRNIFIAAELEAGETAVNAARVDAGRLVAGVVAAFGEKAREKNVAVTVRRGAEKQEFPTDAEKLHLVAANLVANAIEFTPAGKSVSIEAEIEQEQFCLSVLDEGCGIPAEQLPRLFERFHQLDRGSTKKHRGHGLGLSITKEIVDLLRGKITVTQPAAGGTLFRVVLPPVPDAPKDVYAGDGNEFLFEGGTTF